MADSSVSLPLSILLIEPHSGVAARLHDQVLTQVGSAVDMGIARSLREGMNHLCTHRVDVVLMDLILPDYKGCDAIRALRLTAPGCALIAMTTAATDLRGLDAIRAGAHEFLPLGSHAPEGLRDTIARALARNKSAQHHTSFASTSQPAFASARVVHDLNNAITSINGFADILLARLSPDDPTRAGAEQIRQAGARATALVKALTPPQESSPPILAADPAASTQAA